VNNDGHPNDDNGHGTFVATIAAGQANNIAGSAGIAFGVSLLPIKVLDYRGDAMNDHVVKAIRFAADQKADVINLSLGYPPLSALREIGFTDSMLVEIFKPLHAAVRYAQRRGAIIVAAAGNFDFGEVSLPAAFPGVIAVGATNVDRSRASYSSYGRRLDFMAPGGDFTELNGDGVQDYVAMMSIKPHRSEGSLAKPDSFGVFFQLGTSNSSAHVSGAIALLMSMRGIKDEDEIVRALRQTAYNPFSNEPCFDSTYGYGLIQIDKAARKLTRHKKPRHWGHFAKGDFEVDVLTPNPVRGAAELELRAGRVGTVTARVFDVRGALVRTLLAGPAPTGTSLLRWDGRNDRGDEVPAGVYFFRVETPEGNLNHKVAFLR
jgi:serine protease